MARQNDKGKVDVFSILEASSKENATEDTEKKETNTADKDSARLQENPKAVLEAEYNEKYNKTKNKSETHLRRTFLIDADLAKRVDKLSAGKHGFKTEFFNKAITLLLSYYDEEETK